MIDNDSLSGLDQVTSFNEYQTQGNFTPYWEKYMRFKDPIETVVISDYEILDAYSTSAFNEKKNTYTERLNLVLLIKEVPGLIPENHYIRLKLVGCTKDSENKIVRPASVEYSSFIALCRYQDKQAFDSESIRISDYEGKCVHYRNCVGLTGRIAFGTTTEFRGYFSYSAVFYQPSTEPSKPYPFSIYELVVLKGEYRKSHEGECDYITLNKLLQKRVFDLFNPSETVDNYTPNSVIREQRASAIPIEELAIIKASKAVNMESEDDDIPF